MHPEVYRSRLAGVRWSCCRGLACEQGFPGQQSLGPGLGPRRASFPLGRTHWPQPCLV